MEEAELARIREQFAQKVHERFPVRRSSGSRYSSTATSRRSSRGSCWPG